MILHIKSYMYGRHFDDATYSDIYNDYTNNIYLEKYSIAYDISVISDKTEDISAITAESFYLCPGNHDDALIAHNPYQKLYPASTTKLMTAILALKYGNLSDEIIVTDDAIIKEAGASLAGIKPGDQMTLKDLLYGLLLPSGNDAANAIAVHIGGNIDNFVDMMNKEAARLGCVDTHFENPSGLHSDMHYTSAYDLYLIMHEALSYDDYVTISSSKSYMMTYKSSDGISKTVTLENSNYYINEKNKAPDGIIVYAGKTGTTKAAGNCLVIASHDKDENKFISVILKDNGKEALYKDMDILLSKIHQ